MLLIIVYAVKLHLLISAFELSLNSFPFLIISLLLHRPPTPEALQMQR